MPIVKSITEIVCSISYHTAQNKGYTTLPQMLLQSCIDFCYYTFAEEFEAIRTYLQMVQRHRFGYRMAEPVPLHRLAQIMGHDSLDTTNLSIQGTKHDL